MLALQTLTLNTNNLSGVIPEELNSLVQTGLLETFLVYENDLSGTVPKNLCSLDRQRMTTSELIPGTGLGFDCTEQLCGCDWCDCPIRIEEGTDEVVLYGPGGG